jgi:hypothetical protein
MTSTRIVLGGQPLTGVDGYGVRWSTFELGGWGSPPSTLSPVQKTRAPGAWLSPRQLAPRHLSPVGMVEAPDSDALRDALDRLNAACALDGALLEVTEGSLERTMMVYRVDEVLPKWETDTLATWSCGLVAVDPRKYGPQIVASTGLPSSSGGLTWPVTWPIEWDGVTNTGVLHIDNPGNTTAPITLRIDGPCQSPQIRHDGTGAEITFASSYSLAAGSFLTIDMERRLVLEGGTASRNQWVTSRGWFGLDPGGNDLIFSAASYNSSALLTATTAPAYL